MLHELQLVNYCHPDCVPLKNIMRLPEAEAFALAAEMAAKHPNTTAFWRFADFCHYYPRRLAADERLHAAFVALGGQPTEAHPLSFVLEGSDYLDGWFDHGTATRIPLGCVLPEQISFTLGDSMRENSFAMLTLNMLAAAIAAHPGGQSGYLSEMRAKYHYIEVQLWDDAPAILARIADALSLGTLTAPPIRLSGGYTHRMFRLRTTEGEFAVKLLNPEIMQRPGALENYRTAEAFEALLEKENLPILPAKTIAGRKLHCVDGQYLYVFDYFAGRVLRDEEITPAHCARMGRMLACVHALGRRERPAEPEAAAVDWKSLADALLAAPDAHAEGESLLAAAPMLERVSVAMTAANGRLPCMESLCHNDMDAKNVLWRGDEFRVIDLECLDYANPLQEMLDLAISWAGWPAEEGRFRAFVEAYYAAGGERPADAALLYDSRRNHIDWLAYNARRALFDDPEERCVGREQVLETIEKIQNDQRNRATILKWMEEAQPG